MGRTQLLVGAGSGLLVAAIVLALRASGALQTAELAAFDALLAVQPRTPDPRVAVVGITEADAQALWPISDADLRRALEAVLRAGPRAVGLNLFRDVSVPPGAAAFDALLRGDPRVYGIRAEGIAEPPALRGSDRVGFNAVLPDLDGVVRRTLLFQDDGVHEVDWALSLRLALHWLNEQGIAPEPDPRRPELMRLGPTTLTPLELDRGGYRHADLAGYQVLLASCRARDEIDLVPLGDLLASRHDPALLHDRMVVIGHVSRSVGRSFQTPCAGGAEALPGVMLQAALAGELTRIALGESRPIAPAGADVQHAAIVGAALLAAAAGLLARGPLAFLAAVTLGAALLWLGAGEILARQAVWFPPGGPMLAWIGAVSVSAAWASRTEREERRQLMQVFALTESDAIADVLWSQRDVLLSGGRPRPERMVATVVFVDMKGFTSNAEKMDPAALIDWVNEFMEAMSNEVHAHGGIVDDYFGDGMKANFGFPLPSTGDDAIARDTIGAVQCAQAMARRLDAVNARYREQGLPTVAMRIGLNTGPVVRGTIGRGRMKTTSVGEAAITAQRLEALADVEHDFDAEPCRILISGATRERIGDAFACEDLGRFALKGRREPVAVFRVPATGNPAAA